MHNEEKILITGVYDLVLDLYWKLFEDECFKCGHPGCFGPSGDPNVYWSPELGDLQSTIFMLRKIKDTIK